MAIECLNVPKVAKSPLMVTPFLTAPKPRSPGSSAVQKSLQKSSYFDWRVSSAFDSDHKEAVQRHVHQAFQAVQTTTQSTTKHAAPKSSPPPIDQASYHQSTMNGRRRRASREVATITENWIYQLISILETALSENYTQKLKIILFTFSISTRVSLTFANFLSAGRESSNLFLYPIAVIGSAFIWLFSLRNLWISAM